MFFIVFAPAFLASKVNTNLILPYRFSTGLHGPVFYVDLFV